MRTSSVVLALAPLVAAVTPVAAQAKSRPAVAATAPRIITNPYRPALECLASQLTPQQKATSIGVLYLADRTGRDSYSQESGAGKFLSQGAEDMMVSDLAATGMNVVTFNPLFRGVLDWTLPKLAAHNASVAVTLPDIVIEGSFSSFDFGSSNVAELSVFGVGGGKRAYSIRYGMDIRATAMPGGREPAGKVLTTLALEKDIVGRETKLGIASFFGGAGDDTYVQFNVNTQKRELMQYSQRYIVSRAAFGIVSGLWNITTCNEQLAYSDSLVSGQIAQAKILK